MKTLNINTITGVKKKSQHDNYHSEKRIKVLPHVP